MKESEIKEEEEVDKAKLGKIIAKNNWKTIHGYLFEEKEKENLSFHCNGCEKSMQPDAKNPDIVVCSRCTKLYCLDCDIFIHEILLSCPTC
jgi:transcription factor Ssl1